MSNSQELKDAHRASIASTATALGSVTRQEVAPSPMKDFSFTDTGGMKWRAMIISVDGAPALCVAPEDSSGDLNLGVNISSGTAFLFQSDLTAHSLHVGSAMITYNPAHEPGLERLMAAFEEARDDFYGADA